MHASLIDVSSDGWSRDGGWNPALVPPDVLIPLPPSCTSHHVGIALCNSFDGASY